MKEELRIWPLLLLGALCVLAACALVWDRKQTTIGQLLELDAGCEDEVVVLKPGKYKISDLCKPDQFAVFDTKGFVQCRCNIWADDPLEGKDICDIAALKGCPDKDAGVPNDHQVF